MSDEVLSGPKCPGCKKPMKEEYADDGGFDYGKIAWVGIRNYLTGSGIYYHCVNPKCRYCMGPNQKWTMRRSVDGMRWEPAGGLDGWIRRTLNLKPPQKKKKKR